MSNIAVMLISVCIGSGVSVAFLLIGNYFIDRSYRRGMRKIDDDYNRAMTALSKGESSSEL